MKTPLLIILALSGNLIFAQSFVESTDNQFVQVFIGSIAFSDIDGDGDEDMLISGISGPANPSLQLYSNENGNFTAINDTPFEIVGNGSVVFSDIDGDDDPDVLITGYNSIDSTSTKLYTNENGVFTQVANTPFENVAESSVAFADVDGDGDEDVLITGRNQYGFSANHVSILYLNEGGNFTEVSNTPFDGVEFGSIAFSDVDGDGDPDVLITGRNNSLASIAKLYINDGGDFTEMMGTSIQGVEESAIAFSDIDGDGDDDLILTGQISPAFEPVTKLYTNNGGIFSEVTDIPFDDIYRSAVAFADVDGDNDPDLLMSGKNASDELISKLYLNEGGVFNEALDLPFPGLWWSAITFSDVDNDEDADVMISGLDDSFSSFSRLYTNEGELNFIKKCKDCLQFNFSLYPNPVATNQITINYNSASNGRLTANIFDLQGRLISQQVQSTTGNQSFTIETSALSQGTYVLQLQDGKRTGSKEFVVR